MVDPAHRPACSGVRAYVPWEESSPQPVRRTEVPTGAVSVVLGFGPPLRVSSASSPTPVPVSSFVVGMYDEPAVTEHDGAAGGVQIDLTPAGARALLTTPMFELRNRVVPLDAVSPVHLDRLLDRLLSASAWRERVEVLDQELRAAMAAGPRLSPQVAFVEQRLRADPSVRVSVLADEVGWARATLVDRFRRDVGLPPKVLARLLRFRSAAARLRDRPPSIAQVAADCGYADQAHLAREVRAFAGCTPRQLVPPEPAG